MSNVKQPPGRDKSQNWTVCCWPPGSGDRPDGRGPGAGPPKCPCCREYLALCRETKTRVYFVRCVHCFWESPGNISQEEAFRTCQLVVALSSP